jgi:hypothetical protein
MSDTATNGSLDSFLLDGDAPRLGAATPMQPSPSVLDFELLAAEPSVGAAPPGSGSMLLPPRIDAEPVLLALDVPSLPSSVPKAPDAQSGVEDGAEPRHPMANLMPEHGQKSDSQVWAAQVRAAKKAKARKIKILAAIVFLAVAALIGPPLGKWLVDAINESGKLSKAPAATIAPAPVDATVPAATATSVPTAPATTAASGLLGLPGQATDAVNQAGGDVPGATTPAATTPAATVAP